MEPVISTLDLQVLNVQDARFPTPDPPRVALKLRPQVVMCAVSRSGTALMLEPQTRRRLQKTFPQAASKYCHLHAVLICCSWFILAHSLSLSLSLPLSPSLNSKDMSYIRSQFKLIVTSYNDDVDKSLDSFLPGSH